MQRMRVLASHLLLPLLSISSLSCAGHNIGPTGTSFVFRCFAFNGSIVFFLMILLLSMNYLNKSGTSLFQKMHSSHCLNPLLLSKKIGLIGYNRRNSYNSCLNRVQTY